MEYSEVYSLLIRYVDGETTAEESAVAEAMLSEDAHLRSEYQLLKDLNQSIASQGDYGISAETELNWQALNAQISEPKLGVTYTWLPTLIKFAAAAVLIFVSIWLILKPGNTEFASFESGKVYISKNHQTQVIKLEDGSRIVLNENSQLSIDKKFNGKNRLVDLKGEAYFEVAGNKNVPFIVKSGNSMTTVIGTEFEIDAKNPARFVISLYKGKIQFEAENKKAELNAGEIIVFSNTTQKIEKQKIANLVADTWTIAGLSFKDTPLIQITQALESAHSIQISVPLSLQNERYTASFDGLSLTSAIQLLEELTEVKISKKDSKYILIP